MSDSNERLPTHPSPRPRTSSMDSNKSDESNLGDRPVIASEDHERPQGPKPADLQPLIQQETETATENMGRVGFAVAHSNAMDSPSVNSGLANPISPISSRFKEGESPRGSRFKEDGSASSNPRGKEDESPSMTAVGSGSENTMPPRKKSIVKEALVGAKDMAAAAGWSIKAAIRRKSSAGEGHGPMKVIGELSDEETGCLPKRKRGVSDGSNKDGGPSGGDQ